MRYMIMLTLTWVCYVNCFSQPSNKVFSQLDSLYQKFLDNYYNQGDSVDIYLDSLEILTKKHKYPKLLADVKLQRGLVFAEQGNFVQSLALYNEALRINQKIRNADGKAMALMYIGLNYKDQEKYELAVSYMDSSENIYKRLSDLDGVAMVRANKASALRSMNKVKEALALLLENEKHYTQNSNLMNLGIAQNNIGNCYKDLNLYEKAVDYFKRSLNAKRKTGERRNIINNYSNLGDVFALKKDFSTAFLYFDSALYVAREQNMKMYEKDIFMDMSVAYELKGDYINALKYFKLQAGLKDSSLNETFSKQLADLKISYETEEKERENKLLKSEKKIQELDLKEKDRRNFVLILIVVSIAIIALVVTLFFINKSRTARVLAQQNSQINKQNNTLKDLNIELIRNEEALEQSNQAKEQLLSVISHDISSPVSALYNYQHSIIQQLPGMSQVEVADAFSKMKTTTSKLHQLITNLLEYSFTQQKGFKPAIEHVDLLSIVHESVSLLQEISNEKKVELITTIQPGTKIFADQNLLKIIIRNLVSNAIKFSFPNGKVVMEWDPQKNTFWVQDFGKGLSAEELNRIIGSSNQVSSKGTWGEQGTGMGLQIVKNGLHWLGSNLKATSSQQNGTIFSFTLLQSVSEK